MLDGLKERKYVQTTKKKAAPISLTLALAIFAVVMIASFGGAKARTLIDLKGLAIVFGGTIGSLAFQFDLGGVYRSILLVARSFVGTPDQSVQKLIRIVDRAVMEGATLTQIKKVDKLTGDLLGDAIYMYQQGMSFDEIDTFITGRVRDEFFDRELATSILQKASLVAPSFGLFGTVIGLVQVMQSMSSPGQIGPAMSLALMTTAYGVGLASIVFNPLAGRLEHHNYVFLESHKQFLSKLSILIKRDERSFDSVREDVAG